MSDAPGQLRAQIAQLDSQIDRAKAGRTISPRVAAQLDRQVGQLRTTYRDYARGGFTRVELASLTSRLDTVGRQVGAERHDASHAPTAMIRR